MTMFNSYFDITRGYPLLFQQHFPMMNGRCSTWRVKRRPPQIWSWNCRHLWEIWFTMVHTRKNNDLLLENWWSHGLVLKCVWGRRAQNSSIGFLLKTSQNRNFWMILGCTICKNTPEKGNCNGPVGGFHSHLSLQASGSAETHPRVGSTGWMLGK